MLKFLPKLLFWGSFDGGDMAYAEKELGNKSVPGHTAFIVLPKHLAGGNGLALLSYYVSEECFLCGKADRMI